MRPVDDWLPELGLPDPPWVAVDVEASGKHPDDDDFVSSVGIAWPGHQYAFPFDQGVRDKFPTQQLDMFEDTDPNLGEGDWHALMRWLLKQRLVFHNGKYDLTMIRAGTRHFKGYDLLEAFYWDTMVAQHVLDPIEQVGLDVTVQRLGIGEKQNEEQLKAWLRKHKHPTHRYDLVPWHVIKLYLLGDVRLTADLMWHQQDRIPQEGWEPQPRIDRAFELTRTLYSMELRGVGYDETRSLKAAEKLERQIKKWAKDLPFTPTVNEAKKYFFGELKLEADRYTDKGAPSLDEEQVRKWKNDQGAFYQPVAETYANLTKAERAVSMYYRGYPEKMSREDHRLRCVYKQTKVKSGRMSVERVQLQAMPKADKTMPGVPNVRDLLIPREGHGLWNLDLSQAELRVAAHYAKCKTMLEELASDDPDIHGKTTRQVLEVEPDDPTWKLKRDIAKRLTFGGIFQIGAQTFQDTLSRLADIHLPLEECEVIVRRWRSMYPEFGRVYRKAEKVFQDRGYVVLLPHTEYETRSYRGPRDFPNTAWNRIVQGSLAEFFKLWMVEVEKQAPGYMLLTVHDSVLLEMPLTEGDAIAQRVADHGAQMATDLFGIQMFVDTDRWDVNIAKRKNAVDKPGDVPPAMRR